MTELKYQRDSYLKEFEATVTAVDNEQGAIVFDKTVFYPGGGGQPYDLGEIIIDGNTVQVKKVKKTGDYVWHWIEGKLPVAGTKVTGQVDWERRYKLMRTHILPCTYCVE